MTPDELEKRIKKEYALAYGEIKNATKDYFDKLKDRISVQQLRLERGEITQDYYNQWLLNQAGRGERWKDMQQKISDRLVEARKTAVAYTNDTTPGVYTLNRNYSAYQIDTGTGPQEGTAWTAWDESTLKRLQTEDRQLVPLARTVLNINKAEKWNKQHIQSALTSAILQGKSVGQLADSFEALALMDRNSSLRNARTALTGAQNAGRQEAYREADEMGITIKKEWICTQDSRTRDSHIELDGQIVDYDEPFKTSDGHEIMYPGDPTAEPCEVWNCRCTMRAILPKHKINQDRVTYKEWEKEHLSTDNEDNKEYKLSEGSQIINTSSAQNNVQNYKQYESGEKESIIRGYREIEIKKVENADNDIYIASNVKLSNKEIHFIDSNMTKALKIVGLSKDNNVPIIVLASDDLQKNVVASYNASENKIYYNAECVSANVVTKVQHGMVEENKASSSFVHELIHAKDREEYLRIHGNLGKTEEYTKDIRENSLKQLDIIMQKGNNIFVSDYASNSYIEGKYEETYTEYRTKELFK